VIANGFADSAGGGLVPLLVGAASAVLVMNNWSNDP